MDRKSLGAALRNFALLGVPMLVLLTIQWPFKAISEALDHPIDRLHDKIERALGPKQ